MIGKLVCGQIANLFRRVKSAGIDIEPVVANRHHQNNLPVADNEFWRSQAKWIIGNPAPADITGRLGGVFGAKSQLAHR